MKYSTKKALALFLTIILVAIGLHLFGFAVRRVSPLVALLALWIVSTW